jgi:hypothetical protein
VVEYAKRRVYAASAALVAPGVVIVLIWGHRIPPELRDTFLVGFPLIPILRYYGSAARSFERMIWLSFR